MQILVLFSQAAYLTSQICYFLVLELMSLEMFHVLISVELVPNDEFPNFLLLVTKSLCIATTFFSRQAYQFNQSCPYTCFPQEHAETEGPSAFFSGLWGARSTASGSAIYSLLHSHTHTTRGWQVRSFSQRAVASQGLHPRKAASHVGACSAAGVENRNMEERLT